MALTPDVARARELGLDAALSLHAGIGGEFRLQLGVGKEATVAAAEDAVRATAEALAAWLIGTTRMTITRGQVVSQDTGQPTGTPIEGDTVQIHDNEKFSLTVDTKDAKGFETADSITWAADDNGAVVALTVAADSRSCEVVAVSPGSAVITVSDDAAGLSATEAVDVVPGGTATIGLVEGAVEPQ